VNDRYGHAQGDDMLRRIGRALTAGLRKQDHLFRYGGDEFVVLSDGLSHAAAVTLAERLRGAVAAATAGDPGGPVTVSVGVATCPQDGLDIRQMFEAADERLYVAKHAGRDRVVGRDDTLPAIGEPAPA
jgi:diguanylate cyclase (GGDEF)-like protein